VRCHELPSSLEVDHVVHFVSAVDETQVAAHEDVPEAMRRRRQPVSEFGRNWVNLPPEVVVQDEPGVEAPLDVCREVIAIPQPHRCRTLMALIPLSCDLPIVIIESAMLLALRLVLTVAL
jgi:hypothetical protein